jgi:hypothetical protein
MLPKGVENMLVACRAFSSDQEAKTLQLIPHCVASEKPRASAALSVKAGVSPRKLEFSALRKQLIAQNVPRAALIPPKCQKNTGPVAVFEARLSAGPRPGGPPAAEH